MKYSKYLIPEPKEGNPHGEDMIIIKDNTFMVIDGVSGSSDRTGHPSTWKQCRDFLLKFKKYWLKQKHDTFYNMIKEALYKTSNRYHHLQGTFVFALCRITNNLLEYSYVGDCTIFVIRNGKFVLKTKPMYINKNGNMPFQIGYMKKNVELYPIISHMFRLLSNDRIIMCSDGITDNLSDNLILRNSLNAKLLAEKAKNMGIKNDDISVIVIDV